ncbi:MAG TPA: hypothetical protein VF066_13065 [Thermoleophilaceae bacterium]
MARSRLKLTAVCALGLVCLGVFAGCGKSSNKPGETVREGLSTPLAGLRYTVFLTRQLNLMNEEDKGYLPGHKEAPPGKGLYGVFLEACNRSDKEASASTRFFIEDTQGNRFEPEGLGADNPFAFHGGAVPPKNCEPRSGSLAQQGPTSGAMLLFELPLAATENRPLELHIEGPFDSATGSPSEATVILDI